MELFVLDRNTWNYLTAFKNMRSGSFKNAINKMCLQIINLIYKQDFILNTYNGWYAIKSNQTKSYISSIYV